MNFEGPSSDPITTMTTADDSELSPIVKQRKLASKQSQGLFNSELKTCEGGRCLGKTNKGPDCRNTISVERHAANVLCAIDIAKDGSSQGNDLEEVLKDAVPQWCCDRHRGKDLVSGPLGKLLRVTLLHRKMYPEAMRFPQAWTQQRSSHEDIQVDSTLGHRDSHVQSATPDKNLSTDLNLCAGWHPAGAAQDRTGTDHQCHRRLRRKMQGAFQQMSNQDGQLDQHTWRHSGEAGQEDSQFLKRSSHACTPSQIAPRRCADGEEQPGALRALGEVEETHGLTVGTEQVDRPELL